MKAASFFYLLFLPANKNKKNKLNPERLTRISHVEIEHSVYDQTCSLKDSSDDFRV